MASILSSLTSGFFPSSNHDRLYTSDQLANLFSALITDGAIQGSSGDPATIPFKVAFSGSDTTAVTIGKGLAWLKNTWSSNTALASLSMTDTVAVKMDSTRTTTGSAANANQPRWDAICIEVNKSRNVRANSFVVVEGAANSNPSYPVVSEYNNEGEGRFYYALAYVYRPAGSGTVFTQQGSDKLVPAIAQNGGIPYVTALVSEPTSMQDLLKFWDDEIEQKLLDLDLAIAQAGQAQLFEGSVNTVHLAPGAVTNEKIAENTITPDRLAFPTVELTETNRVPGINASSDVLPITASYTIKNDGANTDAGKTIYTNTTSAITVNVDSDDNFTVGTEIEIIRWNSGEVTVQCLHDAVFASTAFSEGTATSFKIANQYGVVVLKLIADNKWIVAGDIG